MAYQYLQTLPQIAQGDANKVWIVPSELGEALKGIGGVLGGSADGSSASTRNGASVSRPDNRVSG